MQNGKTFLPQVDKPLAGQEVNSVASYYRVSAPVASTGPTDSGGGVKNFAWIYVDLPADSTQGGADGTVQDTVVPKLSAHQLNAPENGVNNNEKQMSYADHLKCIAGSDGSVRKGLDKAALEKPAAFLHHISVMKEAIQAMEKHHAEMNGAYVSMSHQTSVQKNGGMPVKNGVNLFGNVLALLELIRVRLSGEAKEMESALKKVVDKQSAKRVRSPSSTEVSPELRHVNKKIPQNNPGKASNIAIPEEELQKIAKLQEEERRKMLQEQKKQR